MHALRAILRNCVLNPRRVPVTWRLVPILTLILSRLSVGADTPRSVVSREIQSQFQRYCLECHDADAAKGGLDLAVLLGTPILDNPNPWERVVRRLQTRQMPPPEKPRPEEKDFQRLIQTIARPLDAAADRHPDTIPTDTFRRLNRTEYQNAIRDLLDLEIDVTTLLPKDDASHGFDNLAVGTLSPTLLNRYVTAAEKISRNAVGAPQKRPGGDVYRTPPDLTQETQVEGLPFGTRGGMRIRHTFPRDGDYEIQIRLTRDRNEHVEGLREPHDLFVLIDGAEHARFTVRPPKGEDHDPVDADLHARISVKAGQRAVGVTFASKPASLLETKRQPYQTHFNMHRHPRLGPAIYQVSINGPYDSLEAGESPSRRRIFSTTPSGPETEDSCATQILGRLTRQAFRRPVGDLDIEKPLAFYRQAKAERGFEAGIEAGLTAILASPEFLMRIEKSPAGASPGTVYPLDDIALASRLAFFIWSSVPDDELLRVAERGELHRPRELERQTRRLLSDSRARNLAVNFGGQWLQLRNLDSITPDLRLFPDFDDNLRQAFRRETELHLESMIREDRSLLELFRTDHTYLNERLAKHYGIPHVYGSAFQKVALEPSSLRGGLLRQGSILTVTSYATRTSPVLRGKWILENLLGTPPPPPPPNVPDLKDNRIEASLSLRERLSQHRSNAQCAGCHRMIDPPGFALENFDAIGRWRVLEEGKPVDASGGLPDGSACDGVAGLEAGLLKRPELVATALTEKLLTFALGRGVGPEDGPAIRKIVREAQADDFRFSRIVVGIVQSKPFTLRKSP